MNLHMVGALDLTPGAEVLEVGFGGGVALALLLAHDPTLRIVGIDLADDMLALARRRFAAELRAGRLELSQGVVEHLPYATARFDAACTANCVYFWPDLDAGLRELARVLRPGASLVVAINSPDALIQAGFAARGLHTLGADEAALRLRTAPALPTPAPAACPTPAATAPGSSMATATPRPEPSVPKDMPN